MSARRRSNNILPPEGTVKGIRARLRRPRWPWSFPKVFLPIRGEGRHAAVFEATAESAEVAARVARIIRDPSSGSSEGDANAGPPNSDDGHIHQTEDDHQTVEIQEADVQVADPGSSSDSDSDLSVDLALPPRNERPRLGDDEFREGMARMMADFRARHPDIWPQAGSPAPSVEPSHNGSPVPSVEPIVDDDFPELHIVLLPPAEVARFRQLRGVGGDGLSAEQDIQEIGRVLLSYTGSVQAREAMDAVVRVLVLPQNRFLRFVVVSSLKSPAVAVAVFAVAAALCLHGLVSYTPARWLLQCYIINPAKDFIKVLTYCSMYALYVTFVKTWKALHSAIAVVNSALLRPMVQGAVGYLEEFHELEAGVARTDAF